MQDRLRDEFAKLVDTIAKLRGPQGCPWDREQTHESLRQHAIEETYEVIEAIDSGDPNKIEDELGDMILQVLMHAQIASEAGQFDIADVCKRHREKLVRRHPHVFSDVEVSGVDEVWANWEQIKSGEPGYDERKSVLDGVPPSLPALMRAQKLSKRAARTGFDWPDVQSVLEKLSEETGELEDAIKSGSESEIRHEIGDVLFTIVNIARFHNIDAEESLREMLARFTTRFTHIEKTAQESGREISDLTLAEMDSIWDEAKGNS